MILSENQVKEIQSEIPPQPWGIWNYRLRDLCETVLHYQSEVRHLVRVNREFVKGLAELTEEVENLKK